MWTQWLCLGAVPVSLTSPFLTVTERARSRCTWRTAGKPGQQAAGPPSPHGLESCMVRSRGGKGAQWPTQKGAGGQVLLVSDTRWRRHKSWGKGVSTQWGYKADKAGSRRTNLLCVKNCPKTETRWKSHGDLTSLISGDRTRTGRVKCSLFSLQFPVSLSELSSGTHGLSSCLRTRNWHDTRDEPPHVVLAHARGVGNLESTVKRTLWRAIMLKPESSHSS